MNQIILYGRVQRKVQIDVVKRSLLAILSKVVVNQYLQYPLGSHLYDDVSPPLFGVLTYVFDVKHTSGGDSALAGLGDGNM